MKPLVLISNDQGTECQIVAAPTNEDCHSLSQYFAKYWDAEITEIDDTGFAAQILIDIPGRPALTLKHDSQTGNALALKNGGHIEIIAADVISDLTERLSDE